MCEPVAISASGYVAAAGDTDGDGHDDFLVGNLGDMTGTSTVGAAWLVLGPSSGRQVLSDAHATLRGTHADGQAGTALAGDGDADGDGLSDVLVGAPYASQAHLFYGPITGSMSLTAANLTMTGEASSDYAGHALAFGGDLDNNGTDDILVGAYGDETSGHLGGAAYVVLTDGM